MDEHGKSDSPMVPEKSPNKAGGPAAEGMEGRGLAKGNSDQDDMLRMQGRERMQRALARVREAAQRDCGLRFTALLHHIYSLDTLREAFYALQRNAAPGVDGVTWKDYEQDVEARLLDLSDRLKRGAYHAKPVRRVFIPKADGRKRPLGVTALEDKIVQRATVEALNAIYETDFRGFSYGFRPGRNQHNALDALFVALDTKPVSWVLEVDIRGFFDTIDRGRLVQFLKRRIADERVIRLIRHWLNAGVLDQGELTWSEAGTPQGASASPLLANVFLHYVFDEWVHEWRSTRAQGVVVVVRYADDLVVGFESQSDAERFRTELAERFQQHGLELHPDKTRLLEFGRHAATDRAARGEGKPGTFDFLGFTHICGRTRKGGFLVLRHTIRKRLRAKLQAVKAELWRRMHDSVPSVGEYLRSVLCGHLRYYGVPTNWDALSAFRHRLARLWRRVLRRRSQRSAVTWERMYRLVARWFPSVRLYHPYPCLSALVTTRGKSRMR